MAVKKGVWKEVTCSACGLCAAGHAYAAEIQPVVITTEASIKKPARLPGISMCLSRLLPLSFRVNARRPWSLPGRPTIFPKKCTVTVQF